MTVKLALLVGIFVALPLLLYGQFESADLKMRNLVSGGIERQSWLIAQALKPILNQPGQLPTGLGDVLAEFTGDNTILKVMFRPAGGRGGDSFYYVASAPAIGTDRINADLDSLSRQGILQELMPSCTWKTSAQVRTVLPGSSEEALTWVVPIESRWGCWVLVASHSLSEFQSTSIGQPYWKEPEIRLALTVYVVMAVLVAFTAWSVWRNLHRFQRVALTLRYGRAREYAFSAQNDIPELARVAAVFDQLVADLRNVARDIRRAAEDNAHSFKNPLATIEASLGPLRRSLPAEDERTDRALVLIDSSLDRLRALVSAAQQLDNIAADLIESPRGRIDLARFVGAALMPYQEVMAERGIRVSARLGDRAHIVASPEAIEVIVENIVDNAISFSPQGGTIEVSVTRTGHAVEFRVADQGPGIDADKLDRIFERYFSLRPRQGDGAPGHSGLGLWIVRRHVEALGGGVTAANRDGGGTSIVIVLPAYR